MKAAVYTGRRALSWTDVAEPECGPGDVKLRVVTNGLCGTDVMEFYDGPRTVLKHGRRSQILGHEIAGEVVEVSDQVADIVIGDRVAIEPAIYCGTCSFCCSGNYNLCDSVHWHGLNSDGGGLAEFTVVPRRMAHVIPSNLSFAHGALVEPMAVALHAVRRSRVSEEDVAVVHGGGPIGIGVILGLAAVGIRRIIAVEPSASRRDILRKLPVESVLTGDSDWLAAELAELTYGLGPKVSFEAAGAPVAFANAIATTRKGGTIVALATTPVTPLDLHAVMHKEVNILGSCASCHDYPSVMDIMSRGGYPTDGWVEHWPAEKLHDALESLRTGTSQKILIDL